MKKLPIHKIGIGGVYQSRDKRAVAVQVTRFSAFGWGRATPYFKWIAKYDGKVLGEGSLTECRKLINAAAQRDEEIAYACT